MTNTLQPCGTCRFYVANGIGENDLKHGTCHHSPPKPERSNFAAYYGEVRANAIGCGQHQALPVNVEPAVREKVAPPGHGARRLK